MKKKKFCFFVAMVMCFTALYPIAMAENVAADRGKIGYGEPVMFTDGNTICEAHIECSLTSYEDGHAIAMVTAEGSPNITVIIDLDEQKIIHKYEHTDFGGYAYAGDVHKDGRMVLGAGNDLIMYDPNKKAFSYLSTPAMNNSAAFGDIDIDEERDLIYSTESSRGNINITNMTTGISSTLVCMDKYWHKGMDIAQMGDYIYTSGMNLVDGDTAYLWKIHKDTGKAEKIKNPDDGLYHYFLYNKEIGKYVMTQAIMKNGEYIDYFYDTENDTWHKIDEKYTIKAAMISEIHDGKRIFMNAETGHVCTVDENMNIVEQEATYGSYLRGTGPWVKINNPELPGYTAITAQFNGNIFAINLETQKVIQIPVAIPGPSLPHRVSYLNPADDMLYIGAFKGGFMAAINTGTGELNYLSSDQPEGMGYDPNTGLFYHGDYSGAHIYEVDKNLPMGRGLDDKVRGKNASYHMGAIGEEQDRPFDLEVVGRELYIGSLPNKATAKFGALAMYNLDTMEKTVWEGIIPGQSILTLTHKGKYLYGGTTVCNGSGQYVDDKPAKVFKFDTETKEMVKVVDFKIPGITGNIAAVPSLEISPDGSVLYGGSHGIFFTMDPETLEIFKYNVYDHSKIIMDQKSGSQVWHESKIFIDERTGYLFYGSALGGIIVDPDTLKVVVKAPGYGAFAGIDKKGFAWFVKDTAAYKVPVIRGDDKSYLLSGVSFFKTGEGVMYRNGDASDFNTYEDNGRIMVPLRTAAMSMGGTVKWDAKTKVATVSNKEGKSFSFNTGSNVVNFENLSLKFGVFMKVENGVTYIPMQTLCDFLNVELVEVNGINFISEEGSNYKPSQELLQYIKSEVYGK